ncbi:MAG: hypothetical protein Q9178_003036 [Gyalolechia marmorata]
MSSTVFHPPSWVATDNLNGRRYPSTTEIMGDWFITHTTSPVWKDKRRVQLTYTAKSSSASGIAERPQLDDLITYQTLTSTKLQTMRGTDTPSPGHPGSWTWRGNGWLKFVKSDWEIVGHGSSAVDDGMKCIWMAVLAQQSLFTPAVLNIYTRGKGGLEHDQLDEVVSALKDLGDGGLRGLADEMYCVIQE